MALSGMSYEVDGDEVKVKVNPTLTLILMPRLVGCFGMQGSLGPGTTPEPGSKLDLMGLARTPRVKIEPLGQTPRVLAAPVPMRPAPRCK